jgi:hypothetical protein
MTQYLGLERKIKRLEKIAGCAAPRVPGTTIQRVLLDESLWKMEGLLKRRGSRSILVWCAGVGQLNEPKVFGYGHTISEALNNVERKLRPENNA